MEWLQLPTVVIQGPQGYSNPDARERGVVLSYDSMNDLSLVRLPYAVPENFFVVNGDNLQEIEWYNTEDNRVISIRGNATQMSLYAGVAFTHAVRFRQAVLLRQSQSGGLVVVRGARLQVLNWQLSMAPSGPFDYEVLRDGRRIRNKTITPRQTGRIANNRVKAFTSKVLVQSHADDARVQLVSASHWPSWIVSMQYTAEMIADHQQQ